MSRVAGVGFTKWRRWGLDTGDYILYRAAEFDD
jgi:hypothetical protein